MDEDIAEGFRDVGRGRNSYRKCCVVAKYASVWKILIVAAGDLYSYARLDHNAAVARPETFKRFPWLMGEKIQHTVLAEMYGMSAENLIKTADELENLHRDGLINAKLARKSVRRERQRCKFIAECDALDALERSS